VTQLHLLRHADAGDPLAWNGPDEQRPLSDKGQKQADRLGRFLAGIDFRPDAIITSPKVRAAQTAEVVGQHLGVGVLVDARLGAALGLAELERVLRSAGDPDRPVIVGHDPDFSDLVAILCDTSRIPMRKGALARIEVGRPLEAGAGTLRWLVPPDMLKHDR
jgi:phosphohistidine phosphatase